MLSCGLSRSHSPRSAETCSVFSRRATIARHLSRRRHRAGAAAARIADSTVALLRDLIRANTSNPPRQRASDRRRPGAPLQSALGFDVQIIPNAGSRGRRTSSRDSGAMGRSGRLLLAAHADVVGVEREKCGSLDPFSRRGRSRTATCLGRGAVDFKGGMAVFARAVLMLAERKDSVGARRHLPRRGG